mmetsp:Transcript_12534/g.24447  ORF Transcript_12534/g.24447 Transcript_12534/m.24447 type:complete len:115 (-) Transcript_12534:44-388(-)
MPSSPFRRALRVKKTIPLGVAAMSSVAEVLGAIRTTVAMAPVNPHVPRDHDKSHYKGHRPPLHRLHHCRLQRHRSRPTPRPTPRSAAATLAATPLCAPNKKKKELVRRLRVAVI